MDSNDSSLLNAPALHRRSSLFLPSSKVQPNGEILQSTKQTKFAEREGSDDGTHLRTSAEAPKESQALKYRSQSVGAIAASIAGAGKLAKLRALGLVIDSSIGE